MTGGRPTPTKRGVTILDRRELAHIGATLLLGGIGWGLRGASFAGLGLALGSVGLSVYFARQAAREVATVTARVVHKTDMVIHGLEVAGLVVPVRNGSDEIVGYQVPMAAVAVSTSSTAASLTVASDGSSPRGKG